MKVKVAQSGPTVCDPVDYTVHGILQTRILEWAAFPFSKDLPNQGSNPGLLHCRRILYQLSHKGNPRILEFFLPGESHEQRSLVGYSPCGCKELDKTNTFNIFLFEATK